MNKPSQPEFFPPAVCWACGHVFPSRAVVLVGTNRHTRLNDIQEPCPRCRGPAYVVPGIYDIIAEAGEIAEELRGTPDFDEAARIAASAAAKSITPEEAANRAERVSPRLAGLFKTVNIVAGAVGAATLVFATIAQVFVSEGVRYHLGDCAVEQFVELPDGVGHCDDDVDPHTAGNEEPEPPRPQPRPKQTQPEGLGQGPANRHGRRRAKAIARKGVKRS